MIRAAPHRDDGHYREASLREFLKQHLPSRFLVTSGFVTDHDREQDNQVDRSWRQIDCLAHDKQDFTPLLRADEFSIVRPESVAAFIEVKSSLEIVRETVRMSTSPSFLTPKGRHYRWAGSLVEALENIKSAVDVMEAASIRRNTYFAGVIAYSARPLRKLPEAMNSGELFKQLGIEEIEHLPDCICVLDGPAWSFSCVAGTDPNVHGDVTTDPNSSYAIGSPRDGEGSALQIFSAHLHHAVAVNRLQQPHMVGGAHSAAGDSAQEQHYRIPVSSKRMLGSTYSNAHHTSNRSTMLSLVFLRAPLFQCPDPFQQDADKSRQRILIGPNRGSTTQ